VATVAVIAIDALYVTIIRSQGGPPSDSPLVAPFVAGFLAAVAIALASSLVVPWPVAKVALRSAAAASLLLTAVLTGFTIGLAVVIPAAIAIVATAWTMSLYPSRASAVEAVAAAVVGLAVVLIGLQLAWQAVTCPSTGESGGSLPTFIGKGATYECSNGVLTVSR
jgi:hypothetical protein